MSVWRAIVNRMTAQPPDSRPQDAPQRPVPRVGHRPEIVRSVAPFDVVSDYQPSGDQPVAIADMTERLDRGEKDVVLLGATGTGKSATTAWLIERIQRPTLIMAHNKTLAAQLAERVPPAPARTTPSNTSSPTTTTTSRRRTSRRRTPSSRRTRRSTTKWSGCGTRPPTPCSPGATWSSCRPSAASTAWAPRRSTSTAWCR